LDQLINQSNRFYLDEAKNRARHQVTLFIGEHYEHQISRLEIRHLHFYLL